MSKKKKEWRAEKDRLLGLSLEDRRKDYRGNYVPLGKISTWANDNNTAFEEEEQKPFSLADKVSLYKGDITILELDAIVNAANSSLLGGGGVDGCIHRAAGHLLYEECHSLNGCDTGKAKITCGYDLPAKYVIHTVGPIARGNVGQTQRDDLEACYKNSLKLMKENNLRSVAFPCISTGIYGFPNEPAAEIALKTVREWILDNQDEIDCVIFCVFLETDYEIYKRKMSDFFSPDNDDHTNEKDDSMSQENSEPKEGGEDDHDPDKKGAKDDDKKSEQGAKDDDKKSQQGAKDDDKKSQQGAKDDDKKIQQGAKDDDKSQQGAKDDDKKSQQDENPDEEIEESNKDVVMESQEPDESPGAEPMEEENKPPEKKDPAVEPSPTAEKKLKQESKNEKEKKEGKGEDPQVPGEGEKKEGSPAKKMQTVPPDEQEKSMEDSTKSDNTKMETGQDTPDAMEVENADQSATAAKENTTTSSSSSTKDDAKAQDVSSQEPDATQPDTRPKSEDGQGNENAQE